MIKFFSAGFRRAFAIQDRLSRKLRLLSFLFVLVVHARLSPRSLAATPHYLTVEEVFTERTSSYFGITSARLPKDGANTSYSIPVPSGTNADDLTQPWFDISNNNILAEVDANGLMEYPVVYGPKKGFTAGAAFADTDFITGSRWTFEFTDGLHKPAALNTLSGTAVAIVDNKFFKWTYKYHDLQIEAIYFAPERIPCGGEQPRGIIALVHITNSGVTALNGKLSISPANMVDADTVAPRMARATIYGGVSYSKPKNHATTNNHIPRFAEVGYAVSGYECVLPMDETAWNPARPDVAFKLAPGASTVRKFALLVGGGAPELVNTRDKLRTRTALQWLNDTWQSHQQRTGVLSIPAAPWVSEMFQRHVACAHTAHLYSGSGFLRSPKGGSWALMSLVAPEYIAGRIPGGDLDVADNLSGAKVSNSLYAATTTTLFAAEWYRHGGDTTLLNSSTFKTQLKKLIDVIAITKYPNCNLYPSAHLWDGPSRGDYHTGSNILVWYVYKSASRIAADVWKDSTLAAPWSAQAEAIRTDILARCTFDGTYGTQLSEGAFASGAINDNVKCHDGEEVVVALSGYYKFLEQDDSLVTNSMRAALTSQNFMYHAETGGMYWNSDTALKANEAGVTAPGFLCHVAGATTEDALRSAFTKWRNLTDVDGSLYWWNYDNSAVNPPQIRRRLSYGWGVEPVDLAKADYATSMFSVLLINNVLGLSADIPAHTVALRPFSPWPFSWTGGRIGNAFFDVSYTDNGNVLTGRLINRNKVSYNAQIELMVPPGRTILDASPTGTRYGRHTLELSGKLAPDQSLQLNLRYTSPADLSLPKKD